MLGDVDISAPCRQLSDMVCFIGSSCRLTVCSGIPTLHHPSLSALYTTHPRQRSVIHIHLLTHIMPDSSMDFYVVVAGGFVNVGLRVSDLVGELQDLQSGTNTSTAADLLKQGAGEC